MPVKLHLKYRSGFGLITSKGMWRERFEQLVRELGVERWESWVLSSGGGDTKEMIQNQPELLEGCWSQ